MKITFKFLWMIFWCHIQDMFTFSQVTAVFFLLKGCFVRNGPVTHVEFGFGCCMSKRSSSLSLLSSSLLLITLSAAALIAHRAVRFLRALLQEAVGSCSLPRHPCEDAIDHNCQGLFLELLWFWLYKVEQAQCFSLPQITTKIPGQSTDSNCLKSLKTQ